MRFQGVGAVLAVLATVGSFLTGLWQVVYPAKEQVAERQLTSPMHSCNWQPYLDTLSRFRGTPQAKRAPGTQKLGEDAYFVYSYDHETERAYCDLIANPQRTRVEASRSGETRKTRQDVIVVCVLVIALAGVGLKLIRTIRNRRDEE
jgi:hypothetical protein